MTVTTINPMVLEAAIEEFPTDPDELRERVRDADAGVWLLVEKNRKSAPDYWLSRHDSPADALRYHAGQDYAEDWQPLWLINLADNERYELWQTFGFTADHLLL